MVFPANDHATKIMKPGEQALNFPAATVATQHTAILGDFPAACGMVRRNQLDAEAFANLRIQRIAVVGAVANQAFGSFRKEAPLEGGSTSFVSCGEALATCTARGRPWPSLIAMILLPLPRRVGPTAEPLFLPN